MIRESVPTVLTLGRLPLIAFGWVLALAGEARGAAFVMLAAVALDLADGALARHWNVTSRLGATLDSAVDLTAYLSLAGWCVLLVPEVRDLWVLVVIYSAAYLLALGLNQLWRGTIADHGGISRSTATVGVISAVWFLLFGYEAFWTGVIMMAGGVDIINRLRMAVMARRFERAKAAMLALDATEVLQRDEP